jgi:hypothetical protein
MKSRLTIFWDVTLCSLVEVYDISEEHTTSIFSGELSTACFLGLLVSPEDGGSLLFRNFPTILPEYMESQPRIFLFIAAAMKTCNLILCIMFS